MANRMRVLAGVVVAAVLAVLAFAAPAAATTAAYVEQAALADLLAIETARIAIERAESDAVKEFARQAVTDRAETLRRLREAAGAVQPPVPVPETLDPARAALVAQLRAAGPEFDRLFLDLQIRTGAATVALHRAYAEAGDTPALRAQADEAARLVQAHVEHLLMVAGTVQPA